MTLRPDLLSSIVSIFLLAASSANVLAASEKDPEFSVLKPQKGAEIVCHSCESLEALIAFARQAQVTHLTTFVAPRLGLIVQKAPLQQKSKAIKGNLGIVTKGIEPSEFGAKPLACGYCEALWEFATVARNDASNNFYEASYFVVNKYSQLAARIRVEIEKDVAPGTYYALAYPQHSASQMPHEYRRLGTIEYFWRLKVDVIAVVPLPATDGYGRPLGTSVATRNNDNISHYLRPFTEIGMRNATGFPPKETHVKVKFQNNDVCEYKWVASGSFPWEFVAGSAFNSSGQPLRDNGSPVFPPSTTNGGGGGETSGTFSGGEGGGTYRLNGASGGVIRTRVCVSGYCWVQKIFI